MSLLLPILKNKQEFDTQKGRGMFIDRLFATEHSAIVMYGKDKGAYMEYSQSVSAEEDERIKEQALLNLENLNVPYEIQEAGGYKIALCLHEYAAEKILDKAFMKKIANDLNSRSVVVGIPVKGFMAVVAKGKGEANLYGAIVKQYNNAQTNPISDSLYNVVDGEVMMVGNSQADTAKETDEILNIIGKNDANGKVGFVVKVGHKHEDELANHIQTAFQNIVLHGIKDSKNFNGQVSFHISPELNKLSDGLVERIRKMAKNISERGAIQIVGALAGGEFKVKFFYGEDKLIAETIEAEPVQLTQKADAPQPQNKPDFDNKIDSKYNDLSQEHLDSEYYRIVSIPNARTNITALVDMSALMAEYKKRGLQMADQRAKAEEKPWWKFW